MELSEHIQKDTLESVREFLKDGKVVVICQTKESLRWLTLKHLLDVADEINAQVEVIPGPSSITSALAACAFLTPRFYYLGFLPREDSTRRNILRSLVDFPDCMVIMDTPYRLKSLIDTLKAIFPSSRRVLVET